MPSWEAKKPSGIIHNKMSQSESEFELESMLNSSSISNTTPTFTDDELGDLSIIACGSIEVPNVANFILSK